MQRSSDTEAATLSAGAKLGIGLALAGIVVLGFGLRAYHLADEYPASDEIMGLQQLDAPNLTEFVRRMFTIDHRIAPVYFVLEYLWSRVAGPSVTGMRLFSVLLGVLALPLTYILGRMLYGAWAGIAAALLHAISLFHIYYSQELRMYSLITLLALLSLCTLLAGLRGKRAWWWGANVAINALLAFTHAFTAPLLLAEGCFLLAFRRRETRSLAAWGAAHFAIMVSLFGWLRLGYATLHASPFQEPGLREVVAAFFLFAGGRLPYHFYPRWEPFGLGLASILIVLIGWFAVRELAWLARSEKGARHCAPWPRGEALGLLALVLFLPALMLYVASLLRTPYFEHRYFIYSSLPVCILTGAALSAMRSRAFKTLAVCGLVFLYGHHLSVLSEGPFRPDWRPVGRYLDARMTPDDRVVFLAGFDVLSLMFTYNIPHTQIQSAQEWPDACGKVARAHAEGRDAWLFVVWYAPDREHIETHFSANNLSFSTANFDGRVCVYHVSSLDKPIRNACSPSTR